MENTSIADTPHKVDVHKLYDTENAMTAYNPTTGKIA